MVLSHANAIGLHWNRPAITEATNVAMTKPIVVHISIRSPGLTARRKYSNKIATLVVPTVT